MADTAVRRVAQGRPTLLLLGQQFEQGAAWPQIAAQVGLDLTAPDFWATLAQAARVRREGRALLIIDALNEGGGADVWLEQLAGLFADAARHPWVAVVVTVRDTYADAVIPEQVRGTTVHLTHPGFAGLEHTALTVYAQHYGLREPDFPPLQPEFSRPLFLRAFCESIQGQGLHTFPRGAATLTWVFDGLLDAVEARLARPDRLDYAVEEAVVHQAMRLLAQRMLDDQAEALPLHTAATLCATVLPSRGGYSTSLLNALITEGLLLKEPAPNSGARNQQQVRFTYQRLSDHVQAEALLQRLPTPQDVAQEVHRLLAGPSHWRHLGLFEALALVIGEQTGTELYALVAADDALHGTPRVDRYLADTSSTHSSGAPLPRSNPEQTTWSSIWRR